MNEQHTGDRHCSLAVLAAHCHSRDHDEAFRMNPRLVSSLCGRGLARLRNGAVEAGRAGIAAAKAISSSIEEEALDSGVKPWVGA
ncbi:MAG TPA: hypothetical protein VMG60_03270 [Burkholderiaceae bacterium]|nr:hypothetical protein [Burkholderiaceae bacterium]